MEIRKATPDDIIDISRIYALSWKTAYRGIIPQSYLDEIKEDFWVSTFESWIGHNSITAQIILDKDRPIGCAAYGKSRDRVLTDWGEIISIYLLPQYFGKGYGHLLLSSSLGDLSKIGYRKVFLWVLKDNQRAKRFYERNKFECNRDENSFTLMGKQLTHIRYIYSF